ncbi:MAG: IS200/IS605 family transposase [Candidatus Ozemobacteraceae bacterium]
MSQSLTKVLVHIVFSTKHRLPLVSDQIRPEMFSYIAGILKELDSPALKIGGTKDHIHILCQLSKNFSLAKVLEEVKKSSSKWLKTKGPEFQKFYWQGGYSAFSVSQSNVEAVAKYIENQREHHLVVSFQNELRKLFEKNAILFNEQYVWD